MARGERRYMSYLLRLWQVRSEGELIWRASLQSAQTRERTGFVSLDALFAYLRLQAGEDTPDPESKPDASGPSLKPSSPEGKAP